VSGRVSRVRGRYNNGQRDAPNGRHVTTRPRVSHVIVIKRRRTRTARRHRFLHAANVSVDGRVVVSSDFCCYFCFGVENFPARSVRVFVLERHVIFHDEAMTNIVQLSNDNALKSYYVVGAHRSKHARHDNYLVRMKCVL